MNGSGSSRRKMVRANVVCDAYVTYACTAQSLRRMAPTRSCRSRVTRRTREEDPSVGLSAEVSKPETDADADADDDAGEGKVRTRRNLRMFNAAREVLDLVRAICEKRRDGDDVMPRSSC